ncbi:hypothetical protein PMAYCL1PPCAC_01856 [Pristionchus mayeri]|uniref:Anion exchange protein n=1 Tax=Pristionchus mayeri TaxID=1317129 RepID=A0AAN4Z319_9BILA|nr:hypothetical protein PMAYCL1PPCAC_01856 [Pristionchus mayeri]
MASRRASFSGFVTVHMPLRGSGSITGAPDIRTSETSLKRRKTSFTDPPLRPHDNELPGNDVLLDPLIIGQALHVSNCVDGPIDTVRRVLAAHEHDHVGDTPIITEMMALERDEEGKWYWQQTARWIKYEQVVEGEMTRFSKPHITLLTIQGLLQARNCLRRGVVLLDVEQHGFASITDAIIDAAATKYKWDERAKARLRHVIRARKCHLGGTPGMDVYGSKKSSRKLVAGLAPAETVATPDDVDSSSDSEEEPPTINVGEAAVKPETKKCNRISKVITSNEHLLARADESTLSATILVGEAPFLSRPLTSFVRLKKPQNLHPSVPDVPIPTKFLFLLLTPSQNYEEECKTIGRTMGAILADDIYRQVALHCTDVYTLADGIEEFVSQMVVIPPGKCEISTRWEPRPVEKKRAVGMICGAMKYHLDDDFPNSDDDDVFEKEDPEKGGEKVRSSGHEQAIVRTGSPFGGLIEDVKRKLPPFKSDFTDFFRGRLSQSLAATIFMFFANITSIITFGAVMERALHHQMAAIEAILCGGLSGVIFAMFSGQPLNILSATGPTLVFEKILFDFCRSNGWDFLPFRVWVGIWIAVYLIIFVATDMSALVGLITRFTEEAFATLISVVFIVQAFQKLLEISHDAPLFPDTKELMHSPCYCIFTAERGNTTVFVREKDVTAEACETRGGTPEGLQCHFKPDVYMLSVLLTFGTFSLAYLLSKFRKTPFFSSSIRNCISDFAVLLSILSMTLLSHFIGLDVPVLHMPESFRPSIVRPWLVDASSIPPLVALIAAAPAAFYTILIVMDQQITAVIINRKDNKLRKGGGYHLDLLIIAFLVIICSFLGLPYFVAATVLSVMHVDSLRVYSESSAPGEVPTFLGVNEQRLTGIFSHLLIGLSVLLTPIIKLVPLPVLIGIFLYMGVVSLFGQQFVQRVALLAMPDKHQPDYTWLRLVRMPRVHLFTFVQIAAVGGLFAVKYTKAISMMFPLMLVFMVLIRMFILSRLFTRSELTSLDDSLPTFGQIMKPKKKENELGKTQLDEDHLMSNLLEKDEEVKGKTMKKSNGAVRETIHEEDE